jgi:CBS domain-containing protein
MASKRIGDLISGRIIYVWTEDNVIEAARLMRKNNISSLLVREKGNFPGILTEKNIINRVVAEEIYPGDVKVREIMSTPLITISMNESIEKAAELMKRKKIRRLVVKDKENIVGIITETDITKHLV